MSTRIGAQIRISGPCSHRHGLIPGSVLPPALPILVYVGRHGLAKSLFFFACFLCLPVSFFCIASPFTCVKNAFIHHFLLLYTHICTHIREVPPDVIFGLYELTLRLWKNGANSAVKGTRRQRLWACKHAEYGWSAEWPRDPDCECLGAASFTRPTTLYSYSYSFCQFVRRGTESRPLLTVWEIPRSRYTHVTGRRRMSAVVLHAVSRDFDLGESWSYIWLNAGLTTKVRV